MSVLATGPVRVVLLNAGKYEHAEVALDRSLHLAGANNIGKTTLVNTLQFLYIDDARAMHFADKSLEETRRYYFPGLYSHIVFECLCRDKHYRCVGLRGLGPARAYAWERYVTEGPYVAEDYVEPDTQRIREPEDVLARLALRQYRPVEPRELRAALGEESAGVPPLGLLPLRNRGDYERFRTLFLYLLRLAHLRQEDLKRLFVEAHAADFQRPQIQLATEFAQSWRTVQRQKREVDALGEIEPDARQFLERHQRWLGTRSEAAAAWRRLLVVVAERRTQRTLALAQIEQRREQDGATLASIEARLGETRGQRDQCLRRLGAIDGELKQRDSLRDSFGSVLVELETASRDNLQAQCDALRQSLASVRGRSLRALASDHAERSRELALRRTELAAAADNLAGWLQQSGFDAAALERLFRVLDPGLLGLPRSGGALAIHDPATFVARLRELDARLQTGSLRAIGVALDIAALPPPALARYADPEALAEAITGLERDLERLQREQAIAADRERGERELAALESRLDECRRRLAGQRDWQTAEARVRPLERERRELEKQQVEIDASLETLAAEAAATRQRIDVSQREAAELEREGKAIERAVQALAPPDPDWEPAALDADDADWRALVERYQRQQQTTAQLAGLLGDARERLARALPRLALDDGFAAALAQELDGLGEKRAALGEAWRGFIAGLSAAFDAQLADLERLRTRIDALNRLLRQAHVSDLKELRLGLRELPESCGVIRQFVLQHKAQVGADLFADKSAFARAEQRVGEFLEQRSALELVELFQLEFEVTRANGVTTRYPHLDRIESNGTSITIKVLTLLTLLRGLMREREGYRLPFFLDEANALDRANLRAIVRLAESFGFAPVLASPDGSDAAARVYVPTRLPNGRVLLSAANALTLERADEDAGERPAPAGG